MDEPGSYLHSSAQSELLHELSKVARRNTIIYCTHSQYLLNPKVIKLGSIKIVEKKGSSITVTNYGSYKGKDDKGALSAVYQALQLNFTRDFIGKIVITEGVTDMYFFEMLLQNSRIFNERFTVIPGTGAGNSSNLISIGLSFSENFVLLLDNDDAGREAERKYKSEFGDDIQRFICFYSSTAGFELEDLLSKSDKRKLTDLAGTKDIKKALALLYYEYTGHQEQFYKNLDQDTLEKLAPTIKRIREL